MRSPFSFLAVAIAILSLAGCGDAGKRDFDNLQGWWESLTYSTGKAFVRGDTLSIDGEEYTFKLNANKRPREIDLYTKGGVLVPSIYELDGDVLKLVTSMGGRIERYDKPRPTSFAATSEYRVITFKRIK